jgi:hypothetical protein
MMELGVWVDYAPVAGAGSCDGHRRALGPGVPGLGPRAGPGPGGGHGGKAGDCGRVFAAGEAELR